VKARHVAEVLAGMTDGPAIGEPMGRPSNEPTSSPRFKENAHEALGDAICKRAAFMRAISSAPRARSRGCPSSTRCATARATIKNHTLAHLDLYLEPTSAR
jgi:hypothetical protein